MMDFKVVSSNGNKTRNAKDLWKNNQNSHKLNGKDRVIPR